MRNVTYFLLFFLFLLSFPTISLQAQDIVKEGIARKTDIAKKYILYADGDFFQLINNRRYEVANYVEDFQVAPEEERRYAVFFVRKGDLYGLVARRARRAKTVKLLDNLQRGRDGYQLFTPEMEGQEIVLLAVNNAGKLWIRGVKGRKIVKEDIRELALNPRFLSGEDLSPEYLAFALNYEGEVFQISARLSRKGKWVRSERYESLAEFFRDKALRPWYELPTGEMSEADYRLLSRKQWGGYELLALRKWAVKYDGFQRRVSFFAALENGFLLGLVVFYERTDTGYRNYFCVPAVTSEQTRELMYKDICSIRGREAQLALGFCLARFVGYWEGIVSYSVATSEAAYCKIEEDKLSGYRVVSVGKQEVSYRNFARRVEVKRCYLPVGLVGMQVHYRRTDTRFAKHFCFPVRLEQGDSSLNDMLFEDLEVLDNQQAQMDLHYMICRYISERF